VDVKIDTSELEALTKRIAADHLKVFATTRQATKEAGDELAERARAAAPRDRPWLATEGIKTQLRSRGTISVRVDVFAINDPERGPIGLWQEYGTVHIPPQPFLGPQVPWAEVAYPVAVNATLDPLK
jgi:hypothetical protein